ncbi:HesB/IscA family protein [Rickettsiales endosymbiont of Stachyamoeba lipophora]|uniref:HesB/IscA family protein n=1 Tax=Rickettsiales endosymbiont of Stachyamoeba lipophora TaxID=2486578 RepID=UPI000F648FD8|nr:iron-sulfur cluster assembly accessory protein [Rickettsiales endosymbiont of Stachyamoeba lipophora]AZL15216.1 iron-sulfur cluster assembly accessory protein [Rickettsiales endosymbiont of Stachyamoeba lipophora]
MTRNIITISDKAITRINELIEQRGKETPGIRVGIKSGGCSGLAYIVEYADTIEPTDIVVIQDDVKVVIDPKAELFLIGTTMDYMEEKFKSGFVFVNPNAKGQCGCGESFHT